MNDHMKRQNAIIPKKAYGQNFIVNPGICPKMVDASGIDDTFGVLEIGPGLGALTTQLANMARKVVAIELDKDLLSRLHENICMHDNITVIHGDVMQLDLARIIEQHFDGMPVAVFGNLPYYITSPIIMRLLEEELPVQMIVAMVQKEAAQRLCAKPSSRETGAVTLAVRYYSEPAMLFDVSPGSFFPQPKVTSSVIKLDVLKERAACPKDKRHMFQVIKAAFAQRRKTAANAIAAGMRIDKAIVAQALVAIGVDVAIRAEKLTIQQYAALSDKITQLE